MNLLTLAQEAGSEGFQEMIHKLEYWTCAFDPVFNA